MAAVRPELHGMQQPPGMVVLFGQRTTFRTDIATVQGIAAIPRDSHNPAAFRLDQDSAMRGTEAADRRSDYGHAGYRTDGLVKYRDGTHARRGRKTAGPASTA